jgi:predicted nucleic acid binding AN1-type Zn finger protein
MCKFRECSKRAAVIIGKCKFCDEDFCPKHRIPEAHACSAIGICKQRAFDRNATDLLEGKCIAAKI